MKQFLFICMFTALSFSGLQAQSVSQATTPELKIELNASNTVSKKTIKEVAAKKKDILNAKIILKLNGKEDLFIVKEKRIAC